MPPDPTPASSPARDGTSQAGRVLRALDPGQTPIDERSPRELLAFAKAFAQELRYFPADGGPDEGDWSGLFQDVDLEAAAAYLRNPEAFSAAQAAPYARPHFALLLAFLQLLDQGRAQANAFTRRHLDYFYRDLLGMSPKPAVPDQVHVLVDLEPGTPRLALPAGTALSAGKDSLGRALVYRSAHALVANRVQVAQIRSLRAEISVTGIRQACPSSLDEAHRDAGFMAMIRIALGQPNPGDPLPIDLATQPPQYPGVPPALGPPAGGPPAAIGFAELVAAARLIDRAGSELGLPAFDDLRALMSLKRQRRDQDASDWTAVNRRLVDAGRQRLPRFDIVPITSDRFNDNVAAALGKGIAELFSEIEEIETMEDAYAAYRSRRAEVALAQALAKALAPLTLEQFESMMQVKTRIDLQWGRITALLEGAALRLDAGFKPAGLRAAAGFEAKLAAALPKFRFAGGIDAFYDAFVSVERYFYMSAESFKVLMAVATRSRDPATDPWAWDKLYQIVEAAHREMIFARRRAVLLRLAQPGLKQRDPRQALGDMLAAVVGEKMAVDAALNELYPAGTPVPEVIAAIAEGRATAPDWDRVAQLLEVLQRNRQDFQAPVAERVVWRHLHPAADATAVLALAVQRDAQATPRWKTFGRVVPQSPSDPLPPAVLGWAISSPLLVLAEGQRTIELTLGFAADPDRFDVATIRRLFSPPALAQPGATYPLQALLSTATGWLEPLTFEVSWAEPGMLAYPLANDPDAAQLRSLVLRISLAKGQPALAPLLPAVHGLASAAPVLRLMMRPFWDGERPATHYQVLRKLLLLRLQLRVQVRGLEGLQLQNDQSVLDAKQPFEPFGINPAVGSRLSLGHPEIVGKQLASLSLNLSWMGVPAAGFTAHYANYSVKLGDAEATLDNSSFKATLALSDEGVLRYFTPAQNPVPAAGAAVDPATLRAPLFNALDATLPVTITLRPPDNQGVPAAVVNAPDEVIAWPRCLVWELTPVDFQHAAYPGVALKKSLQLAVDLANRPATSVKPPAEYQVNAPYTPKIKRLTLDYSAVAEWALKSGAAVPQGIQLFHVHPFGPAALAPDAAAPGCALLPAYDFEGELYIGLRGVVAPQNVSLLFQVAEGSADPDLAPEPVQWSYLSADRWLTLQDGGLLADASRGLINTGIVELALKPARPSTLLPAELYWIRVAIPRASGGVCDLVEIAPNALLASFADADNAPDHLSTPLAPQSIQAPVLPTPGIASLRQPYTAFGGKTAERDASFQVRVSERLRHKRRALTGWDYERLVLERFPQIYKVKCLRADAATQALDPGRIVLVVIPDIRNRLPFNPFEPKLPADQIRDIQAFLQDKTPPFARIEVRNAHYVPVKVRCGVRFLPGRDEGYCRQRLGEELNRFLSPWAFDDGADIVIGGSVYANSIINFIDQRDYVDYLAGFKLFTGDDEVLVADGDDGGYRASTPRADGVLVAARQHQFDVIAEADYRIEEFTGLNYMMIELDFSVA